MKRADESRPWMRKSNYIDSRFSRPLHWISFVTVRHISKKVCPLSPLYLGFSKINCNPVVGVAGAITEVLPLTIQVKTRWRSTIFWKYVHHYSSLVLCQSMVPCFSNRSPKIFRIKSKKMHISMCIYLCMCTCVLPCTGLQPTWPSLQWVGIWSHNFCKALFVFVVFASIRGIGFACFLHITEWFCFVVWVGLVVYNENTRRLLSCLHSLFSNRGRSNWIPKHWFYQPKTPFTKPFG